MVRSLTRARRASRSTAPPRRSSPPQLAALADALAAWRATRSAALAGAIDALGDAALAGWEPPAPRTNQAFHASWLAALAPRELRELREPREPCEPCEDDVLRGWAARTLLERLPGRDSEQRATAFCERLAALRAAPADPRVGRAVVELVGQQLQILGHAAVLDAIVDALAVHGDERTATHARQRLAIADPATAQLVERSLAAQPAPERAATPAELERFVDRRAPPAARAQIDALFREVHARPDADDPRLVLADALLAQGDPRGELIALQLAVGRGGAAEDGRRQIAAGGDPGGSADRARGLPRGIDLQLDRIDQLLRDYGKRWLGTLREVTFRARFERGFLTRLELNGRWTATERGWAQHVADPTLGTVEDLISGRSVGEIYARFMTSPAMIALRRIEVFDKPTLDALRTTAADLVHIAVPRWKIGKYVPELAYHVLPACERFSALRSFAVHIDGAPSVLASPLCEQLTALIVAGGLPQGLALWPRLPRALSLTVARTALLDDCATARVAWPGALQLWRDDQHIIARAAGEWLIGELIEHFAALPSALQRLEVEGAAERAAALTAAAQRRGIELVLLPSPRRTGYLSGFDR